MLDILLPDTYWLRDQPFIYDSENSGYIDIITTSSGTTVVYEFDQDKKLLGIRKEAYCQYLISKDDRIFSLYNHGCKSKKFLEHIFQTNLNDDCKLWHQLLKSIVAFNIYTFEVRLISKERIKAQYGTILKERIFEDDFEYIGYTIPPLVLIRYKDKGFNVPDIIIKPKYNVRHEWILINPSPDYPESNENTDLAICLTRCPYIKEE